MAPWLSRRSDYVEEISKNEFPWWLWSCNHLYVRFVNFFYTLAAAIIIFPLCWFFFSLTIAIIVTVCLFIITQVITLWWWYHWHILYNPIFIFSKWKYRASMGISSKRVISVWKSMAMRPITPYSLMMSADVFRPYEAPKRRTLCQHERILHRQFQEITRQKSRRSLDCSQKNRGLREGHRPRSGNSCLRATRFELTNYKKGWLLAWEVTLWWFISSVSGAGFWL